MSRRTTRTTDAGIGSRRRSAGPSQAKGATASYWTTRTTFKTIDSPAERASAIGFFRNVWSQRFNDAKRGHHVIVMQRGHEDDLASLVMERGGFEHLNLPSEYERTPFVIVSGEKIAVEGFAGDTQERDEVIATMKPTCTENGFAFVALSPVDPTPA